ncbi:MAG: hypothetical protein AAFX96_03895, partial [Pseudomonadota bacterium]
VADHENPTSCVVGYVDARANKGANVLARKLADERAESFVCASDKPQIIGKKGRYFGNPVNSFN